MKRNIRIALILGVFAVVGGSALTLSAAPTKEHLLLNALAHIKQTRQAEFKQVLQLSPEQEIELKAIRKKAWLEIKPIAKDTVDQYQSLARYLVSADADESKALQMKQKALVLQQRIASIRIHMLFEIKKELSDTQKAKMTELVERRLTLLEEEQPYLQQKLESLVLE